MDKIIQKTVAVTMLQQLESRIIKLLICFITNINNFGNQSM